MRSKVAVFRCKRNSADRQTERLRVMSAESMHLRQQRLSEVLGWPIAENQMEGTFVSSAKKELLQRLLQHRERFGIFLVDFLTS